MTLVRVFHLLTALSQDRRRLYSTTGCEELSRVQQTTTYNPNRVGVCTIKRGADGVIVPVSRRMIPVSTSVRTGVTCLISDVLFLLR